MQQPMRKNKKCSLYKKKKEVKAKQVPKTIFIPFILAFFFLVRAPAQETVPASGGDASGSGGTVSYSVGQLFFNIHTGTSGSVAGGVQQPWEISVVTGIPEAEGIDLLVSAFPNPATDYLILRVGNYDHQNLSYQLFDVNGRLIANRQIESNQTRIDMTGLVYGVYFLRVYSREITDPTGISQPSRRVKTFKIVKN